MSFSNDVREEIARSITDRDRQFACLYGILLYSRIFTQEQVVLQSESPVFARLMPMLFRAVFRTELQPDVRTISRGGDQSMVSYTITDAAQISRICEVYHIRPEKREIRLSNLVNNSLSAFLAGVFFGCGSMIDPNKEYHLEFNTPSELLCSDLQKLLGSIGISGGQLLRKNMYVLYLKDSEHIEDTLTYMGAQQCTIALMNIKIRKDMRNKANRVRNCDEANINKVVGAAIRQIQDIQWITQCGQLEALSPELQELAELRLENPELSLKELGELAEINEPIRETYYKGNERIDEVTPKYALLSTHAGRRTFICNALALGIPAQVVMKWTGHSDYKAMKPYIDIADDIKANAMNKFNQL